MRGKFRVVGALGAVALLALGVGACGDTASTDSGGGAAASASPAAPSQTVTVDSVGVAPKVHLKVGDTLVVTLHSNSSTGYQWKAEGMEEEAVLKQDGEPEIVAPKSDLAGAPGKTKFTFVAEEEGTEELGFWYMPPGEGGEPGAGYALIVKVGKGHIPVDVKAGEEYTAETAELRTGDTLVVTLKHASDQGRHAWQMVGGSPFLKLGSQKYSSGTETLTFSGASAGTGTLVLVNRPGGDPPLQTFAVPIYVKTPKQPVTHQLNHNDDNENLVVKGGDTIQVSLQDQPSTDYQWEFQKPNAKVLKQVGKPKFFPNSDAIGAKGKMVWTFSVVGAGKAPLIARLQHAAGGHDADQDLAGRRGRQARLHAQDRRRGRHRPGRQRPRPAGRRGQGPAEQQRRRLGRPDQVQAAHGLEARQVRAERPPSPTRPRTTAW